MDKYIEQMLANEYPYYLNMFDDYAIQAYGLHTGAVYHLWRDTISLSSKYNFSILEFGGSYDEVLKRFIRIDVSNKYPIRYIEFKARIVSFISQYYMQPNYSWEIEKNHIKTICDTMIAEWKAYDDNRPVLLLEIASALDYIDRDTLSIVLSYQL